MFFVVRLTSKVPVFPFIYILKVNRSRALAITKMKGRSGFDILRQRRIQNDSSSDNFINLESGTEEIIYRKNQHKVISSEKKIWLFLMVLHALIFYLIQYKHYDFPKPLSNIEAGNNIFSEERARKFLQGLTSFGMRLVGSEENEKMAVKHIMNELEQIKQHSLKKIQVRYILI